MPLKDREAYLTYQREFYQNNKRRAYWRNVKAKYGLVEDEVHQLLEDQNGECALCERPLEFDGNKLHIDHCHETGRIRGLLCMPCNVALGMLGDNEVGLTRALNYIKGDA